MNECKPHLPTLSELTQRLREHGIMLRWDVGLAGLLLISSKSLPQELRGTVWRYSRELFALHILADVRLCRDPDSHRQTWYYLGGKFKLFCCERCFVHGMDNRRPLHKAADVLVVMSREQDEGAAV